MVHCTFISKTATSDLVGRHVDVIFCCIPSGRPRNRFFFSWPLGPDAESAGLRHPPLAGTHGEGWKVGGSDDGALGECASAAEG